MEQVRAPAPRTAKRLKAGQVQELVTAYEAGATVYQLADRFGILFLYDFVNELNEPVRDSYEQIDYVPTQILTEYLLKVHHQEEGDNIQGLMYTSAVTGKPCVVLDVSNEQCVNQDDDEISRFNSEGLRLRMTAGSKETFKIKRTYEPLPREDPFA